MVESELCLERLEDIKKERGMRRKAWQAKDSCASALWEDMTKKEGTSRAGSAV